MLFAEGDLAKYPFLPQAAEYVRQLDLTIEDLTETLQEILKHAEQRVTAALETSSQTRYVPKTPRANIEIPSFPVAIMIVAAINDRYLKKRYALYEAKKIYEHLRQEKKQEKIREIANCFKWNIKTTPQTTETYHGPDI